MISSEPCVGDVWLMYLRFEDHPEIGKVRPVLVVALSMDEATVLKITSKPPKEDGEGLRIADLSSAGLRKQSFVRLNPAFIVAREELLRKIGALAGNDYLAFQAKLSSK